MASRFDGALAGMMGMADASIIWWLKLHGGSGDTLVDRLTREITEVLIDLLSQLGLDVPDDMVLKPQV